jgi:hypothetical protein
MRIQFLPGYVIGTFDQQIAQVLIAGFGDT